MLIRIYKLINFCRCILIVIPCLTRNPVLFLSLDSRFRGNDSTTLSLVLRKLYKLLLVILILGIFSTPAYSSSDWKITLKVTGGGIYDYCIAGVKDGATDGRDSAWDIPSPPHSPYETYIYTYFPHPEWGYVFYKFREDIKAPDLPKEWIFEVSSNVSGELTIQWPDLNNAIPDKDAVLIDIDGGGGVIDMNTSSSFVFVNNSTPRRFLVRISEALPAPEPPQSLNGKLSKAGVVLSWKRNRERDLAGYNVYRSTIPGSGYQRINSSLISVPKYIDKEIVKGNTYYVVTAVNTAGGESGYSNQVGVIVK
jgi:hypothetical protein